MWQCPKCKREFKKVKQTHSCTHYPIENHFKDKTRSQHLFEEFVKKIEKNIGKVKIESLPCCIHLVSDYTFSGVWILKDRFRIDFRVDYKIQSNRIEREERLSKNRLLYFIEIKEEKDIDEEILKWIKDSYYLKN